MIIVTGAAGFIGSNLVRGLNRRGITDILAVDDLTEGDKFVNLVDCKIADYMDKDDFRRRVLDGSLSHVRAVLHQGACSDTTERNGRYMLDNNYRVTLELFEFCQARDPVHLRVLGGGVRRFVGVCRRSRQRRSAERLRLFQAAVRPGAAHPHGHAQVPGRGPALLQCLRSA